MSIHNKIGEGLAGLGHFATGGMFKGPEDINQNFAFGDQASRTNQYSGGNPDLMASVNNLNQMGGQMQGQFNQMIDPNSQYNAGLYGQASTGIQEQGAQRFQQQNQAIASRGGPASMASLLGAVGQSQDGNTYANAVRSIGNSSLQQAQGFGQMATQAYGQAGGLNAGIDARQMQNNQFNTENENSYNQYLANSNYNQDVQNQNASQAHKNSMLSMVGGIAGSALGGGMFDPGGMFGGGG